MLSFVPNPGTARSEADSLNVINTEIDVINRALEYAGFKAGAKGFEMPAISSVGIEQIIDSITPFFHDSINGKKAWEVVIDSFNFSFISPHCNPDSNHLWSFRIYIDPDSFRLIKISALKKGYQPDSSTALSVAWREKNRSNEIHYGYPSVFPKLSFLDALGKMRSPSPLLGGQVVATYALCTVKYGDYGDTLSRPVWSITVLGLPPKKVYAPDTGGLYEICPWHEAYNVIDAMTGEFLGGGESAR